MAEALGGKIRKRGSPESDLVTPDVLQGAYSLLPLAVSQPNEALAIARKLLSERPGNEVASYAHQAAGIVLRDAGQLRPALRDMSAAIRCARATGSDLRVSDVQATYGATLAVAGRTREGLEQLDQALSLARGELVARVRLRRGYVLWMLGRYAEALVDLQHAIRATRRNGDVLWEARSLNNRFMVHLAVGDIKHAEADVRRAEILYESLGQVLESIHATHNRGLVELRRGDLPAALSFLDAAADRYQRLKAPAPDLVIDRVQALLAAGLASEAVADVERALVENDIQPTRRAELLLTASSAALAAGDPRQAQSRADAAVRLFAHQRRPRWVAEAQLVSAQAQYAAGRSDRRLLAAAVRLASTLRGHRAEETALAHLLAGRVALELGEHDAAWNALSAAAQYRSSGPPLTRAAGWLAHALAADLTGRSRQLLAACSHGLDALDEHRLYFGNELKAYATQHGAELAALALRNCLRRGRTRQLFAWSERWRATALMVPSVNPPDDEALADELAAYREASQRIVQTRREGADVDGREHDRDAWESAIRRRRRHERGSKPSPTGIDLVALEQGLGSSRLITLVQIEEILYTITLLNGHVRRRIVGPIAEARRELEFAQFALRRAALGRSTDLRRVGASLEGTLLGAVARTCGAEPVVLVPPSDLHGVPWGLLPSLAEVPFTVAPSAAMWLRASQRHAPAARKVTLVVAPGLSTEDTEAAAVGELYDQPTVLVGDAATVPETLSNLEGAWIGHIAAHGTFRVDSPLFSCLHLADGPLTIHDLERLRQPPHTVLLSACDSAVLAPVGSEEVLGLVTGLLGTGTASVLASVVHVNDAATIPVMRAIHTGLRDGSTLAEAWLAARREALGDLSASATAASFTAWGA